MAKITIFKPTGEVLRFIPNATQFETEGPLLTATYTNKKNAPVSIRTTLPYFFEEGDSEESGFKADVWNG
jgi:hypothetical protein